MGKLFGNAPDELDEDLELGVLFSRNVEQPFETNSRAGDVHDVLSFYLNSVAERCDLFGKA